MFLPRKKILSQTKINIMNCYCKETFDLRCVCHPIADYRKLKKIMETNMKHDFRKCPQRHNNCIEFILNDYNMYKSIENAPTEKKKISVLKKIIIKQFKLTKEDFKIIFDNYIITIDNIINNLQES
jgi:hypothetical protein